MGFSYKEWEDVTIIVPAYEAEATIERALKSVEKQTVCAQRIIVVDSGSSDDTVAIARRVADVDGWNIPIDVIELQGTSLGEARNHGLKISKSDYVAFLDADDEWHKLKLEKSLEELRKDEELAFVAHDVMVHKANGRKYFQDAASVFERSTDKQIGLFLQDYIQTSTIVLRRERVLKANGFNEQFSHGITQDLILKILENDKLKFRVFRGGYTMYHESHRSLSTRLIPTISAHEYFALEHVRKISKKSYVPTSFLLIMRIVYMYKDLFTIAVARHLYIQILLLCLRMPYALLKMTVFYVFRIHKLLVSNGARAA